MAANWSTNGQMTDVLRKPTWPCGWCGLRTTSARKVCKNCLGINSRADAEPSDEHALKGGVWVNRGGVQRWVQSAVPCGRTLRIVGISPHTEVKDTTNASTPEQRRWNAARGPRRPVKDTTD